MSLECESWIADKNVVQGMKVITDRFNCAYFGIIDWKCHYDVTMSFGKHSYQTSFK